MDEIEITLAGDQVIVKTGAFTPEVHADADKLISLLDKILARKETTKLKPEHVHRRHDEQQYMHE